jgi:hypothetical protein
VAVIAWNDLYDEIEAAVAGVWTDVVRDGQRLIWEGDHVQTIPFDEILATYDLPYAVIVFPSPEPDTRALANRSYLQTVECYWVGESTLGSTTHRTKAEALASAMWGVTLTNGALFNPPPLPVWGRSLEINELLLSKKSGILAAGVWLSVLTHEEGPANP